MTTPSINCPAIECCDPNPFAESNIVCPQPSLSLGQTVACSTCFGAGYTNTITAVGIGPTLTWSIVSGALPTGLTFHGGTNSTGSVLIDGTPTAAGAFTVTIKAVDPYGQIATGTFTLHVIEITTASLPAWQVGVPYSAQLQATGGSGNYAWKINSGALPDGLVLDVSGLIHGTPTGVNSGTTPIVFEVIDITCEESSGFFVPSVLLVTSSVTTILTWLGYDEFVASTPPKKYKTITWNGSSKRIGFTCEPSPRQCAGAKFEFSGVGQIDTNGNQLSNYSKKFYAQCPKQFWPLAPLMINDQAINVGSFPGYEFVGFCWGGMAESCAICDPIEANWPFIGEKATNDPQLDLTTFVRQVHDNNPVVTPTSFTLNEVFDALTAIGGFKYTFTLFGTDLDNYLIPVGARTLIGRQLVTNPPNLDFPNVAIKDTGGSFVVGAYINFTDTANYSVVLSDEYTDAEAEANKVVINGNSRTCQNFPRTTGFESLFTTVNYDLQCGNLIVGAYYRVQVDFLDSDGSKSTLEEVFQATSLTHTINHNVLAPAAGMSRTVFNPRISFVT